MNVLPLLERQTDRNFIHLNGVNVTNFTWKSRARIKKSRIDINNIIYYVHMGRRLNSLWVLFLFNATTNSDLLNPLALTELVLILTTNRGQMMGILILSDALFSLLLLNA